jgi:hypothetical protein
MAVSKHQQDLSHTMHDCVGHEALMKQIYDNSTGHIIADFEGKRMLLDTGAAKTFFDEYQGLRIVDLSRMIGAPLDGVIGMDSLHGKVVSLTRNTIQINGDAPELVGAPLKFVGGLPCIDIKINEVPCRAVIKTGATTSYISEELISRDKHTRYVDDIHPLHGKFRVKMFVNYFSVCDKNYFADAGELPGKFSMISSVGVDAIIGADLLNRFDLVMDFSDNRLHLISN